MMLQKLKIAALQWAAGRCMILALEARTEGRQEAADRLLRYAMTFAQRVDRERAR